MQTQPQVQTPLFTAPPAYQLPKLKTLPLRDQPAYRVASNAAACSLAELLAAVVGGEKQIETAEAVLARFQGDIHQIQRAHVDELGSVRGVGQVTAIRIKAALAIGARLTDYSGEKVQINSPADAAALVQYEMSLLEQEYLKVFLLDTRNRVLDIVEIYHGCVNSSQVRIAEVFKPAIQRMCPAIICCHNHPSGDCGASPDDVAVTRALVQAGKLLDIQVLDHLIIGKGAWVSLRKRVLAFRSENPA